MCQLSDSYTDIFSKQATYIGKTDLIKITVRPKTDIKPIDPKPYILPLQHLAWLRQELTELERTGIISPSISNFASPVTLVFKKKHPSTHEISYGMVANFRKINEQLEYLVLSLDENR